MQRVIDLTLDCFNARAMAAFWKLALGYIDEPAPEPFQSRFEWLASQGVPPEEWNRVAWLCDPDGIGPRLSIVSVPEGEVAKNRLHMDIRISSQGREDYRWGRLMSLVDALVHAGGQVLQPFPKHHVVMADPEGNEFCVAFTGLDDGRASSEGAPSSG